ncbi:MAG: phosphoesterase, partial [Pseudomonadota bacterium]
MSEAHALESDEVGAIEVNGAALDPLCDGALHWRSERMILVADLHLEKGSSFAVGGQLIPPYDTASTIRRLSAVIARYDPRVVVALGDNFHDRGGAKRMAETDRVALKGLQAGREWLWITG